jgi:flagellar motor switch protein FliN
MADQPSAGDTPPSVEPSAAAAIEATAPTDASAPAEAAVPDGADAGAPADPFAGIGSSDIPELDQAAIDELLKQANFEDPTALPAAPSAAMPDTSNFELPNFQQAMADAQVSSIDLLRDVELNVKIELGRSRMLVEDVLKLGEGSVVELDKLAGDPVDVFVNDRLVARGEVLVLNDNFCVRVNEIVAGAKDDLA